MRDFPISDVGLFHPDLSPAGRLIEIDMAADPPFLRFQGVEKPELDRLCILREDLEKITAWSIEVVDHEFDGIGCVTFEEGMPHADEFQKAPHNRGKELRVYPYRLQGTLWTQLPADSGFVDEAFRFDCGVQVGRQAILSVMGQLVSMQGRQMIREGGRVASEFKFQKTAEIQIGGVTYWIGTGLELPVLRY